MSLTAEIKHEIVELALPAHNKCDFFNEIEFKKDIYNIFIIKKMVARFLRSGVINEKLVLNNIIIALNTFENERANKIFRVALKDEEYSVVKSFLLFLDAFTNEEDGVEPNEIITSILLNVAERYHLRYRYDN